MFSFWFPKIAHAAPTNIKALIAKIEILLINPFIKLMFAAALILFLYGVFEFIQGAEGDSARTKGRTHIMYGLIGMFVMVSVFGIMRLLANSLGVDNTNYSTLPN